MRTRVLTGLLLFAGGCASHPAPTQQVASSIAAVRSADEAGARSVPEAAAQLKMAEDQIKEAKRLMDNEEDNLRAEDLALRAYQDAELAMAMARDQTAQNKLHQLASAGTSGGEQMTGMPQPSDQPFTP